MTITLPARFEEELNRIDNFPSILLELVEGFLENTQTTQADWTANSSESQVDYTTISGSVILAADTIPDEENLVDNTSITICSTVGTDDTAWQSFKQTTGAVKRLTTLDLKMGAVGAAGTIQANIQIFADDKTTALSASVPVAVNGLGPTIYQVDFTSQNISIENNTTYRISVTGTVLGGSGLRSLSIRYQNADVYADGFFEINAGGDIGDAYFSAAFDGDYYQTPGTIETQNMTLDSTPTVEGEWLISDRVPTSTTLTYNAEGSATGAWAGEEVNLGAIVDGDTIGAPYYQYYRVTASFANTDKNKTAELQEITVQFADKLKISDNDVLGYEPSVEKVSSLTTNIGDFKNTSIGQLTVTLSRTEAVETYFLSGSIYPQNKPAQLRFGFIVDASLSQEKLLNQYNLVEGEYLIFYTGVIDNFKVDKNDHIIVTIKDNGTQLDQDLPTSADIDSNPVTSPIVYTAQHPSDVMLDILQNEVDIRDSQIDLDSFADIKTSLAGWQVTRTISNDRWNAKDLLEELRKLMSAYLIPKPDGKIFIKEWDAAEAQADAWTDDDFMSISWDRNTVSMVNSAMTYYDWQNAIVPVTRATDDDYTDFAQATLTTDAASISDYDEVRDLLTKDRWTRAAESAQVTAFNANIIARYKNPPGILNVQMDMNKLAYEVGDIIDITTARAIGSATGGLTNEHSQIINKNLDFQRGTLTFKLLQVAGD